LILRQKCGSDQTARQLIESASGDARFVRSRLRMAKKFKKAKLRTSRPARSEQPRVEESQKLR